MHPHLNYRVSIHCCLPRSCVSDNNRQRTQQKQAAAAAERAAAAAAANDRRPSRSAPSPDLDAADASLVTGAKRRRSAAVRAFGGGGGSGGGASGSGGGGSGAASPLDSIQGRRMRSTAELHGVPPVAASAAATLPQRSPQRSSQRPAQRSFLRSARQAPAAAMPTQSEIPARQKQLTVQGPPAAGSGSDDGALASPNESDHEADVSRYTALLILILSEITGSQAAWQPRRTIQISDLLAVRDVCVCWSDRDVGSAVVAAFHQLE